jgi:hypothetical protein
MMFQNPADVQSSLEEQFEGRLFTRRVDLTTGIRLKIANDALHAMMNSAWGTITNVANDYSISRTFVYLLANTLKHAGSSLFSEVAEFVPELSLRMLSIQMMLSLRLEGRSSYDAVSTIME